MCISFFSFSVAWAEREGPAHDLEYIFNLALGNDPKLQQASHVRLAALESEPQAIARLLPLFSATGSTNWNYFRTKKLGSLQGLQAAAGRSSKAVQTYWQDSFVVNLKQPLMHWDYWIQLSQTENQIAKAEAEYQTVLQDLMSRTIKAYLDILLAKDTLRFANAEKESLSRQFEQAQQRFDVGLIAITDVLEAQSGFDGARSREIVAENNLDDAIEALREITGEYDRQLVPLPETIPLMKPQPLNINEWAYSADSQNLMIIAAQNDAELARKTIELQRSGHFPTLDVVGNFNVQDNSAQGFGLRGETGSVGVQFNLPIYEGGAVNSRTREALYKYNAAKDNLLAVRRQVARQVRDAYRGVISTISQVEALDAAIRSSATALEAITAGFEVGTRTMVDVVNEQRNLYQARNNLSEARNNYILNWVSLKESASNLSQDDIKILNDILLGISGRNSGLKRDRVK